MPHVMTLQQQSLLNGPFNKSPFGLLTAIPNLCRQAKAKNLIFDIRVLPLGEYSFPYHYHRNAEEVMYIIDGEMTARTESGFIKLCKGDVLFCETGKTGAHQFYNHSSNNCTYFDVKVFFGMDVVVYPDSDKIMISQYNEVFDLNSQMDYFKGEEDIAQRWKDLGYRTQ